MYEISIQGIIFLDPEMCAVYTLVENSFNWALKTPVLWESEITYEERAACTTLRAEAKARPSPQSGIFDTARIITNPFFLTA